MAYISYLSRNVLPFASPFRPSSAMSVPLVVMSESGRGPRGNPPQDTDAAFCALRSLGQAASGAPTGGSGGEFAANTSPFTLVQDFSEELSSGG